MIKKTKIFVDSDVIISSLISTTGAAYFLLHETDTNLFISNKSVEELKEVVERLSLSHEKLESVIQNKFRLVRLSRIAKRKLAEYVSDVDDTHVLAGAKKAKAQFLVSYNVRHFKVDKIRKDFNIAVMTPAIFLQYLRSVQ